MELSGGWEQKTEQGLSSNSFVPLQPCTTPVSMSDSTYESNLKIMDYFSLVDRTSEVGIPSSTSPQAHNYEASSLRRQPSGDGKLHGCSQCDFKAPTLARLTQHIVVHSDEKPFACTECRYRSKYRGNLIIHLRVHSGEKPFVCTMCGYKASQTSSLKTHMKTHSADKPFKCGKCPYRAKLATSLKMHDRTHTGIKPYACSSCDFRSAQKSSLNTHIKTHCLSEAEFTGNDGVLRPALSSRRKMRR